MRILFTGGGTGGHIYPIIAIKKTLERIEQGLPAGKARIEFLYIGPNSFAKGAFKKENIKCKFILAGKLRRYFSLANFVDLFKIPIGLIQSLWYVFSFMPDVLFSKGGYGSIPVVFVSWLYRIPIIIHDSDNIPGLANRISARFARKIIVSFEMAKKYFPPQKTVLLGIPVREELTQGNEEEGRRLFELKSDPKSSDGTSKPVVLIMGGSQGAQKINEVVFNTLPRLLEKYEIIHVCGNKNLKQLKADHEKIQYYHPYPFLEIEKLKHAYAVSDIIISRAGATSIFEIAAIGKPSILIPLSSAASGHQMQNAQALARIGGAIILKEENLTMNMFLGAIFRLSDNPEKLKEMSKKVKSFYKPETNQKIVEEILRLCQ